MKTGHWLALGVAVFVAAILASVALSANNADLPAPPRQVAPDDDLASFRNHNLDGHPGRICEAADHHGGYVYTQHRYPRIPGGEITALIHRGFSPMRIPANTPDAQWIASPPSEVMY
jgi:hypothetical protein